MKEKLKTTLGSWAIVLIAVIAVQFFNNRGLVQGVPPPLAAPTADGKAFAGLESLPKPAIVYFWASWCPICKSMESTMAKLAEDTPMITVALQSGTAAEVSEYLRKEHFAVPVLVDEDGAIGKAYGLRGVPAVFIVGPDGTLQYGTAGYSTTWGLRFRLWLAGLGAG